MTAASDALKRLSEGNRRFVAADGSEAGQIDPPHRAQLAGGQKPFAVVLGCSDSRVPPELIFDQGLGELFVIRVAGNTVAPDQVGSIEFAADQFGARLVVVLGHTDCGAVKATLQTLEQGSHAPTPSLQHIVDSIRPAVQTVYESTASPEQAVAESVRANVRAAVANLPDKSELLARLIRDDGLVVVGAEYDLATGAVDFFDGGPSID